MEFYLANKRNKMAGVSNTKTPFVFATKEDLSMLIDKADTLNTKKQISCAVNRMTMFASSADVPSIQAKSQTKLDCFLGRKEDGSYYTKNQCMGFATVYEDSSCR